MIEPPHDTVFVVKVQVPFGSVVPGKERVALIYTKGRQRAWTVPAAEVDARMGGKPKAYFNAFERDGTLVLGDELPVQPW